VSRHGESQSLAALLLEQRAPPPWTPRMFEAACRAGCFEDMKVELVGGRLILMTEGPEHVNCVTNAAEAFELILPKSAWHVTRQTSVRFSGWTPLPDVAVCRGSREHEYKHKLPRASDVVLLVEVSHSTYRYDRRVKYPKYAKAGVPIYWIVDLDRRRVEVWSLPLTRAYRSRLVFQEHDTVPVVIDGNTAGHVAVREIPPLCTRLTFRLSTSEGIGYVERT
jgi:Uma2 family endonuclease